MPDDDLASVSFPRLDDTQIAALARFAKAAVARHRDGEVLFGRRPGVQFVP